MTEQGTYEPGTIVRVREAHGVWGGHVGVVTEARGGLVTTGPIFSPRGIRYGHTFTWWHKDVEPLGGIWTAAQVRALQALVRVAS